MPLTRVKKVQTNALADASTFITTSSTNAVTPAMLTTNNMRYELIEAKVWSSDGSADNSGYIEFQNCFSNSYSQYRLEIVWLGYTGTNADNLYLQPMTGTNTGDTTTDCFGNLTISDHSSAGINSSGSTNTASGAYGSIWRNLWTKSSTGGKDYGGITGFLEWRQIHFQSTISGHSTSDWNETRPYAFGTLMGYDTAEGYARGDFHFRFNTGRAPGYWTGFRMYATNTGTFQKHSHMYLYGLKFPE